MKILEMIFQSPMFCIGIVGIIVNISIFLHLNKVLPGNILKTSMLLSICAGGAIAVLRFILFPSFYLLMLVGVIIVFYLMKTTLTKNLNIKKAVLISALSGFLSLITEETVYIFGFYIKEFSLQNVFNPELFIIYGTIVVTLVQGLLSSLINGFVAFVTIYVCKRLT